MSKNIFFIPQRILVELNKTALNKVTNMATMNPALISWRLVNEVMNNQVINDMKKMAIRLFIGRDFMAGLLRKNIQISLSVLDGSHHSVQNRFLDARNN